MLDIFIASLAARAEMGRGAALTTSGGEKIKDAASTSGPDHQGENRKRSKMLKLCQPSCLSESFKMRENIFKKFWGNLIPTNEQTGSFRPDLFQSNFWFWGLDTDQGQKSKMLESLAIQLYTLNCKTLYSCNLWRQLRLKPIYVFLFCLFHYIGKSVNLPLRIDMYMV